MGPKCHSICPYKRDTEKRDAQRGEMRREGSHAERGDAQRGEPHREGRHRERGDVLRGEIHSRRG